MQKIILLCDIFGINPSIQRVKEHLEAKGAEVSVCSAYEKDVDFRDESGAYEEFLRVCGHEPYYEKAKSLVEEFEPTLIIGFSVGASVAWRLSALKFECCKNIVCFYPSQIRNHLDLTPVVPIQVYLAKEKHFDVNEVYSSIHQYKNVSVDLCDYSHGFMNESSIGYSQEAFQTYLMNLDSLL